MFEMGWVNIYAQRFGLAATARDASMTRRRPRKWMQEAPLTCFQHGGIDLITGTAGLIISRPAEATAQFATDTGKVCGQCHESATGGGKLTPFGQAFKANGNKLP
jgi:hypothetical protein